MAILGKAALAVWLECLPEAEAEFDRWYREQHLAERVAVPGFLRGRRYQAVRGAPKYFALYETESADVLRSPAYLERLNNPTEWTLRVMPTVRNFTRGVYWLLHTEGGAGAGDPAQAVATLRLDPVAGRADALRARYRSDALKAMAGIPGVLSATLFEADPAASGAATIERSLIGTAASAPVLFCLCELEDAAVAERPGWRALLASGGPARGDDVRDVVEGTYRLLHALSHARG
jgi:hypothetical protein